MTSYKITGPSQARPADFHHALLLASFKKAFLRFLKDEWAAQIYGTLLVGHIVYFAMEEHCYMYTAVEGKVHQTVVAGLCMKRWTQDLYSMPNILDSTPL